MIPSKKIIMLANGHSPFDTRIFEKEARSLSTMGFEISIIVPARQDEVRDNIRIIAVPLHKGGWRKLVATPVNIFFKCIRQSSKAIYQIHDSDLLIVGILLKVMGRKVVYDAHEDTPLQISYQHWIPRWAQKPYAYFYYLIEKLCGRIFDAIIVAEPVIAKYFPKHKTFLVRNFAIAESFKTYPAVPYRQRKRRLVYLGTLSEVRGLSKMVEAAILASQQISNFELTLGGKFAPLNLEERTPKQYPVNFIGWLSYSQMLDVLFDAQIGIIVPDPNPRYTTNYPVKLFEYMASGLPVITSKFGEAATFVKEANCGILVDPLNVPEIRDAIVWLFNNPVEAEAMGRRGRDLILNKYNWEFETRTLLQVFGSL